ncbi:hypothetical protein KFE25_006459 [Diacronema lutheri]|uniref:Uncharacterized protein n=1 Tax=Diacronema lutheri TaxID=2081491 RepID=A0A8J5XKX7_DIALT|nr:hypothetical protein KFE25_006453 [Diacronema lutheri]KAG8470004.1 hypothetical protein KFE25_006459 [Diacronema lutheri]
MLFGRFGARVRQWGRTALPKAQLFGRQLAQGLHTGARIARQITDFGDRAIQYATDHHLGGDAIRPVLDSGRAILGEARLGARIADDVGSGLDGLVTGFERRPAGPGPGPRR